MDRKIEKLSTNDEVFFGVRNEDFDIWYDTHGFKQFVITQCIPNTFEEVFLGYINYFLLLCYSIWNFTLYQLFPLVIFIQYEISLTRLFLTNMVCNPMHPKQTNKELKSINLKKEKKKKTYLLTTQGPQLWSTKWPKPTTTELWKYLGFLQKPNKPN